MCTYELDRHLNVLACMLLLLTYQSALLYLSVYLTRSKENHTALNYANIFNTFYCIK